MLSNQDKSILKAYATLLPAVNEIINRIVNDSPVGAGAVEQVSHEDNEGSGRRLKLRYGHLRLHQNAAVHMVLKDLAITKTAAELKSMFTPEDIFKANRRQQQILVTPEEHKTFTANYQTRYNVDDPIKTVDGVVLYVWTNWGLFKTIGQEKIEDSTPRFIRIAQKNGIDISMPE